eukprot:g16867.t1
MKQSVLAHKDDAVAALHADLRRDPEGAAREVETVIEEIDHAVADLAKWVQPEEVDAAPFEGARAKITYESRGIVLLFSPWNYPFALLLQPLASIIAAGNCALAKPNELAPNVSKVVAEIIRDAFDEKDVAVFEGGVDLANELLELPIDHIFFTGSPAVGKIIMGAAAKHLASVTLELGGKNPVILDRNVDLAAAAGNIAFMRNLNNGQVCLCPENIWVPEEMAEEFIAVVEATYQASFYKDGELNPETNGKIIDERNFQRVKGYIDDAREKGATIRLGGDTDADLRTIHPTLMTDVPADAKIMGEETFGPILNLFTYKEVEEAFSHIQQNPKPLALYVFTKDDDFTEKVLSHTSSGGVTVNSCLIHVVVPGLPFGGVNASGIGAYHGEHGFRELSHRSCLRLLAPSVELTYDSLGLDYKRLLHAEEKFDYLKPIYAGDQVTLKAEVADIYDKKDGALEFIVIVTSIYRDDDLLQKITGTLGKKEAEEGREVFRKVVNISSISGVRGNPGQVNYAAAKKGLIGITETLAKEWGRYKVNVNCVAYGMIETRLTQEVEGEKPDVQIGGRSVKSYHLFLEQLKRYVRERLVPAEREVIEADAIPAPILDEMRELGLFGLNIPEEYGGAGMSASQYLASTAELSWAAPAFRSVIAIGNGIVGAALAKNGTEAQKHQWLTAMAEGSIVSFAITEPDSGSDSAALRTTAEKVEDDYVLNGVKRYITNAPIADLILIRNRAIMGSMHTGLEETENGFERMAAYFAERAKGGVGMIITGGIAPNSEGGTIGHAKLSTEEEAEQHRIVTRKVHETDPDVKICLQILHSGPLSRNPDLVAPSAIQSPISRLVPNELDAAGVEKQINDHVNCAVLAQKAGYDGVEIIGSAGYLVSSFLVEKTNQRTDEYGGSYENRMRFAIEIISRARKALGDDFILIFRIAAMDMLQGGMSWDEVVTLGKRIEEAGATIISTHFTWHESAVPTIATMVPRAAFTSVTGRLRKHLNVPVITSNRINMPDVAEEVLERGDADLVSMARPMLADSQFMIKAREEREDEINTCIACNQACLDHTFNGVTSSCLVNPRACHETELNYPPAENRKRIAVVGAGPAGLAYSTIAAERGHDVTLFDAADEIGGQFNLAKKVPGKEEFYETLRYYGRMIELHGVKLNLGNYVTSEQLVEDGFDHVVVATGITPRKPDIDGIDHEKAVIYTDVIQGLKPVGEKVAVIGAGGIGFDVCELISHSGPSGALDQDVFAKEWGIDFANHPRGGVTGIKPEVAKSNRQIWLLQRKDTAVGRGLGRTTGWTHRLALSRRGVTMLNAVQYLKIDDEGLHIKREGEVEVLPVDTVIICAGQESKRGLYDELQDTEISSELIGGAFRAAELDAKAAIKQASYSAAEI